MFREYQGLLEMEKEMSHFRSWNVILHESMNDARGKTEAKTVQSSLSDYVRQKIKLNLAAQDMGSRVDSRMTACIGLMPLDSCVCTGYRV